MNSLLSLTKVFLKSLSMSSITDKKKKIIFSTLLGIVLLFIFLPFIFGCEIFVYWMTTSLKDVGYSTIGFEILCNIIAIFTFFFSFNVILNQLYFSEDLENLFSLPIKAEVIMLSKFITCFIAENIMEFLLLLASLIGFVLGLQLHFTNFIFGLIGIVTLPIIPMIYCSIISLFLMYFTKFIKNKETIRKLSIIFVVLVLLIFAHYIGVIQQFNLIEYVESFANGNHKFLEFMRYIFPHISLYIDSVKNCSIISLFLYLLFNLVYIVIFVILGKLLYLDSVIELSSKDTDVKNNNINISKVKEHSVFYSYLSKEIKVLFRSPVFFINCILINFIWPIFVYLIYKICFDNMSLNTMISINNSNNFLTILLIFIIGVSILIPALNSISSSSFSRDGSYFNFIKYVPIHYSIQWNVKVVVSLLISFIGINIFTTIFFIIIKLDFIYILIFYLISLLCVLLISMLGTLIDSIQPKLIWDDEANSLRENYNTFMVMGFALLLFAILCGGSYYLFVNNYTFNMIVSTIVFILIILLLFTLYFTNKYGIHNIIEQEEV